MRRALAVLAAAAAVLALAGCGPDHGTVLEKHAYPGYWYSSIECALYRTSTVRTKYGSSSTSYCAFYRTVHHWWPPSWELDIRNGKDEGWVSVDGGTWVRARVGGYIDLRNPR